MRLFFCVGSNQLWDMPDFNKHGKVYRCRVGSRSQVWSGVAYETAAGLIKRDLRMAQNGRIVSVQRQRLVCSSERGIRADQHEQIGAASQHNSSPQSGHRANKGMFLRKRPTLSQQSQAVTESPEHVVERSTPELGRFAKFRNWIQSCVMRS